ncbi:GHKL domain protein [SAR86 cluster bacterium SAR86E]|jgi:two-component system phosphate regulon sensor histidine kinase PhoR|uniref:histidine kinase n=1 Tax=SAR86 cluster bacterium SAR86E TaxID=1208365 RepID=K6GIW3_9GAMM|nr:GHKL domain protein [SAR86 cluster bacterium SAR86E]
MGIRTRIFFITLSCLFAGITLSFIVAERDLSIKLQEQIETELSRQAKILRKSISDSSLKNSLISLKQLIDEYAFASDSRITIIKKNGIVTVDSDVDLESIPALENHKNRPEIIEAFESGMGSSKRFSSTVQKEMFYFALRDDSNNESQVIRISVPYENLDQVITSLGNSISLIVVVGLIVAILASILAGDYIRSSFVELERAASEISAGSYKKKNFASLPTKRSDEIGSMARNISTISLNLKDQISLIAKQRDQFGLVLDGLGEGIMVLKEDGEITYRNDQILQIFDLDEILNKSIHDLNIQPLSHMFKKALKKGKYDSEFEIDTEEDSTRWILAHMNKAKATKELILVVHETTQLREMDSMRRDFVSNLSHELRTPVSVIKANSETLLDGALENPKDAKTFSKAILHNADRLSEMVTSLIDLSRIEYGDLKFVIESLVLNQIIETVISSYSTMAKRKNIQLLFNRQTDIEVTGDSKAIERVLNNLIDNAFKYSPEDSVIEVQARKQGDFVKVSVMDAGIGVPDEEKRFVFQRFYRTAKARANEKQGSGLGLAIVRNLVNNLKGEVGVESRRDGGSEFWFTVPVSE